MGNTKIRSVSHPHSPLQKSLPQLKRTFEVLGESYLVNRVQEIVHVYRVHIIHLPEVFICRALYQEVVFVFYFSAVTNLTDPILSLCFSIPSSLYLQSVTGASDLAYQFSHMERQAQMFRDNEITVDYLVHLYTCSPGRFWLASLFFQVVL